MKRANKNIKNDAKRQRVLCWRYVSIRLSNMKVLKQILFALLFEIFLVIYLDFTMKFEIYISGIFILVVFGALYNFIAMSVFFFASFLVPFSFPRSFYETKQIECNGKIYSYLGVQVIRWFLTHRPFSHIGFIRFDGKKSNLSKLYREMEGAETAHLILFILIIFVSIYAYKKGWAEIAASIMLFNVIGNLYTALLQRLNRVRLQTMLNDKDRHKYIS